MHEINGNLMIINRRKVKDENGHLRKTTIWDIEIDYTNEDDLELLFRRVKNQLNSIRSEKGDKISRKKERFEACVEIYETNIDDLYSDQTLDTTRNYYVYAHCYDKKIAIKKDGITTWLATFGLDLIPFYIGKGTGRRAYDLNRNGTHKKVRQKLRTFNQDINVRIIKDNLTELEAFVLESKLIDILGCIGKGGKLVNLDEGANSKIRQNRYKSSLIKLNDFYSQTLEFRPNLI
jgi:hypothetical protein